MIQRIATCLLGTLLLAASLALAGPAQAAAPVELLYAYSGATATDPNYAYEIKVANLGSPKTVGIWYKNRSSTDPWKFQPAHFVKSLPNNQEQWEVVLDDFAELTGQFDFAVKYTVAGHTYWDNNNGKNYTAAGVLGVAMGTAKVALAAPYGSSTARYQNGILSAQIYVASASPTQTVGVVYTTDGWKTRHTGYASWLSNGFYPALQGRNPGEIWQLNLTTVFWDQTHPLEFAVWYTVNGSTYWDNNYGQNYQVLSAQ